MVSEETHKRRAFMASPLATKVEHRSGGETWLFEEMSSGDLERATADLLRYDVWGAFDYEFWEPFLDKIDERERRIGMVFIAGLEHEHFWVPKSEIEGWSQQQLETAIELIDSGRTEDLYIQPIYLAALLRRLGVEGTMDEIEGCSAQDRLNVLKSIELQKNINKWEYRYYLWADDLLAYVLLSYPLLVGTLIWLIFGLPIAPQRAQDFEQTPVWAMPTLSWADENGFLPLAYHLVSFGPAVLAAILSFGLVLFANVARRPPPRSF